MKKQSFTKTKNEGALGKRFIRHRGIYRPDVLLLLVNLAQSATVRSDPGQAIGRAGRNMPCPSFAMSSGRLFLVGVLASIARLRNRRLARALFLLDPRPRDLLAFTRIMSRKACERVPPKTHVAAAYANKTNLTWSLLCQQFNRRHKRLHIGRQDRTVPMFRC